MKIENKIFFGDLDFAGKRRSKSSKKDPFYLSNIDSIPLLKNYFFNPKINSRIIELRPNKLEKLKKVESFSSFDRGSIIPIINSINDKQLFLNNETDGLLDIINFHLNENLALPLLNQLKTGYKNDIDMSEVFERLSKLGLNGVAEKIRSLINEQKINEYTAYVLGNQVSKLALGTQLDERVILAWLDNAMAILEIVKEKNSKAERDDEKIDVFNFEVKSLPGLVNLFAISEELSADILNNTLHQRAYLPIVQNTLEVFSDLSPEAVRTLNRVYLSKKEIFDEDPGFIIDLTCYLKAYKDLSVSKDGKSTDETFELDCINSGTTVSEISANLGRSIILELCKPNNLNISLDEKVLNENPDILNNLDLRYLGTLVSTRTSWDEDETALIRLLFKATIEGTQRGLFYPPDYSKIPKETYGADEKTQNLVTEIRTHNLTLLSEMKELGLNLKVWLNPNAAVPPIFTDDSLQQRNPNKLIADFRKSFEAFEDWLSDGYLNDPTIINHPNSKAVQDKLQGIVRKYFNGVKQELSGVLSKKENDCENRILHLQKQHLEALLGKVKCKHTLFIDSILQILGGYVPEVIADLQARLTEIDNYDLEKKNKVKNYCIKFWDRHIGKEYSLGNRAGSCTALDRNKIAIFNFFRDLGTHYAVITDPDKTYNKQVSIQNGLDSPPVGYARFWLGIDHEGNPAVFIDSIDGSQANANESKLLKQIVYLAYKAGVNENNVFLRNTSTYRVTIDPRSGNIVKTDLGFTHVPIKDKIGGAPVGYFHHARDLKIQPRNEPAVSPGKSLTKRLVQFSLAS